LGGTKGIRWDYDILQLPRKSPIAFHWCAVLTGGELALRSMLFGVKAWDVGTLVAVTVVLAFGIDAGELYPARRGASVDPVEALRAE
jgi:ABC-type lipoprotein release transport system permease subunit